MKRVVLNSLVLLPFLSVVDGHAADGLPELDGRWESMACELRPQAGPNGVQPWYLTRSIVFSGNRIDAHFVTYADPGCGAPLLELKFGGDVAVRGPSRVAVGAMEVDLIVNDYLTVTPRMAGFADFLNSADAGTCGAVRWEAGREQDVYETGCTVLGIAANTPTNEFEVLHVSAGQLFFGARPVDGSSLDTAESRPTALQMPLQLVGGGATRKVGAGDVRTPQVVEIVTFEQQPGAATADVQAFFENITVKMNQNDTLLYRTIAQGADGAWLLVNYWQTRAAMETLNAQAQGWTDEFAEMALFAKPDSFRLTSYDIGE